MADKDITKSNPEFIEELRNYFMPKPEIVSSLPNPKGMENFKIIYIKQSDNTYKRYNLLNGTWIEL
jgi:hypothetical protein